MLNSAVMSHKLRVRHRQWLRDYVLSVWLHNCAFSYNLTQSWFYINRLRFVLAKQVDLSHAALTLVNAIGSRATLVSSAHVFQRGMTGCYAKKAKRRCPITARAHGLRHGVARFALAALADRSDYVTCVTSLRW